MPEFWMSLICSLIVAGAAVPLLWASRVVLDSTLLPTVSWLFASWLAWLGVEVFLLLSWPSWPVMHMALALSACAGISVLGARRPGLGAWNFVTLALFVVLLMPLLEQPWDAPQWGIDAPRTVFISVVLAVGVLNFAPTSWGVAALLCGGLLGIEVAGLAAPVMRQAVPPAVWAFVPAALAMTAWPAAGALGRKPSNQFAVDCLWLGFRDRFGFLWAKRVQEQFNQAAMNAGYVERLGWGGISPSDVTGARQAELVRLLEAVLKRFGVSQQVNT